MQVLLDRSGADPRAWLFALMYLADINNICADELLDDMPPLSIRRGIVLDISPYLLFRFNQPLYYLDAEETFPDSKEKTGYWMGVAHNIGDTMTFWIWPKDGSEPIARSVVRPMDGSYPNHRVSHDKSKDVKSEDAESDSSDDSTESDDASYHDTILGTEDKTVPNRPSDSTPTALDIVRKSRRTASKKQKHHAK